MLDANLSWRLTKMLKTHFDDCLHVDSIGLQVPASDIDICEVRAGKRPDYRNQR